MDIPYAPIIRIEDVHASLCPSCGMYRRIRADQTGSAVGCHSCSQIYSPIQMTCFVEGEWAKDPMHFRLKVQGGDVRP